jgi:hypothetical protein
MNNQDSPLSASTATQPPTHEEISGRAQELWEKYGRPEGRDEEIWLEAERELQRTATGRSTPTLAPAPTSASATAAPTPTTTASPATTRAPQRPSRAAATPRMPATSRGSRSAAK